MKHRLLISLLAATSLQQAFGATIYDNGTFNSLGGNAMGDFIEADNFVIGSLVNVTGFTFWTLEAASAYLGSVTWSINANTANQPGAALLSGSATPTRTSVGTALGLTVFQNDVTIAGSLAAGTYWLTLHDGALASVAFQDFYWAWTNLNGTNTGTLRGKERSLDPPSATWDDTGNEHAFLISGTTGAATPEPASMAMIAGGLGFLAIARKRFGL